MPPEDAHVGNESSDFHRLLQSALERRILQRTALTHGQAQEAVTTRLGIVEDIESAERLADRHNGALITDDLISRLLAYIDSGYNPVIFQSIDTALRAKVKRNGFFIQHYSKEIIEGRILDRHPSGEKKYLLVEASVAHQTAGAQGTANVPYADAQFALPSMSTDAHHVVDLPHPGDDYVNRDLVEEFESMPYAVASLDDIVCEEAMSRRHLAAAALKRGLAEIAAMNGERGMQKIRYVAACIASIRGIRLRNGATWNLYEDGRLSPIFNERSAELFEHLRDCPPFRTAYILRDRPVEVEHDRVQSLIVDWHVKVAELKD